mmetsp:Transcript_40222/g.104170  ORF Transcript_40222/g.104170 Transcript_40222/m.104170 type:complete len:80 (-) Transcript_40222:908-1147(-)
MHSFRSVFNSGTRNFLTLVSKAASFTEGGAILKPLFLSLDPSQGDTKVRFPTTTELLLLEHYYHPVSQTCNKRKSNFTL